MGEKWIKKFKKMVSIPNATGLFLLWKNMELKKEDFEFQYLMLQVCSYYSSGDEAKVASSGVSIPNATGLFLLCIMRYWIIALNAVSIPNATGLFLV